MVDNNRVKRPKAERKQPIRTTRRILDDGMKGSQQTANAQTDARREAAPADEIIGKAVKLAYRVVDQHIQQGRHAAARVRAGTYNSVDLEADLKSLVDRMIGLTRELGSVSVELFDTLIRGKPEEAATAPSAADVAIEVKSGRRVQVSVKLRPTARGFVPSVPPLHASDRSLAPLDKIHFLVNGEAQPVLVVEIPDEQPVGIYSGVIVDEKTHEPGGDICVRVLA